MISFAPTDEQTQASQMLDAVALGGLRPRARDVDRVGALDATCLALMNDTGLLEMALDEDAQLQRARTSDVIALEALARGDAAFATAIGAPLGLIRAVLDHGTVAQCEALRERFRTDASRTGAVLIHEPRFGFDPAALATRTRTDGADVILSGVKGAVPRAGECAEFLVVAASDQGASAWLVAADAAGVTILPSEGTLGLQSLALTEVLFEDVRLPLSARLGGAEGCEVQALIDAARIANAAILTGVADAVFRHLVPYLKDRVAHGSALAQKQSVAFRLADMSIDIPSMRWMTWRAAAAMDKGRSATREARLAQIHCSEQALWITDEGIQLMGGHGYLRDNPVERWYRDVRTLASLEGMVGL